MFRASRWSAVFLSVLWVAAAPLSFAATPGVSVETRDSFDDLRWDFADIISLVVDARGGKSVLMAVETATSMPDANSMCNSDGSSAVVLSVLFAVFSPDGSRERPAAASSWQAASFYSDCNAYVFEVGTCNKTGNGTKCSQTEAIVGATDANILAFFVPFESIGLPGGGQDASGWTIGEIRAQAVVQTSELAIESTDWAPDEHLGSLDLFLNSAIYEPASQGGDIGLVDDLLPSWGVPAGIGGLLLLVVGIVVARGRKKKGARNRAPVARGQVMQAPTSPRPPATDPSYIPPPSQIPAAPAAPPPSGMAGAPAQEGMIAGRYRVERSLGIGAFGEVFLAHDNALDRKVVVKSLHMHLTGHQVFKDNVMREARTAAKVNHPNIISVYDAPQDGSSMHIVMEFVEGSSLEDMLKARGTIPVATALKIGYETARGLEAIHRIGIMHRDLKPANILLTSDGIAKIGDFGIAKQGEESTGLSMTAAVPGTVGYMSPEQAMGKRDLDGRSDLFSLGLVIFKALAGQSAFDLTGLTDVEQRIHIAEGNVAWDMLPASVPASVRALLMTALAKDPADRYPDAKAMALAIRKAHGASSGTFTPQN